MSLEVLRRDFARLKKLRRTDPVTSLRLVGAFAATSVELLTGGYERTEIRWRGIGAKTYDVFVVPGTAVKFSRPVNRDLYVADASEFNERWARLTAAVVASSGTAVLA